MSGGPELRDGVGRPVAVAFVAFAVSIGGVIAWMAQAPLASAVLAEGAIAVEGDIKTVQHLEGGIVAKLLVQEGDDVAAGETLVRLDTTEAQSERAALIAERDALAARAVRLRAELRDGAPDFAALASSERGTLASAIAGQAALFKARAQERVAEQRMLDGTLQRLRARSAAIAATLDGIAQRIALAEEEMGVKEDLASRGVASRAVVRQAEQALVALRGEEAALGASLAEARAAEAEAELQRAETDSKRISSVSDEMSKVEARLAEVKPTLLAVSERIARSVVRAPVDGTVVGLSVATIGGVIAPGEPIMTIVPNSPVLIAEAEVAPTDRERLTEGMTGEVRLAGLEARGEASLHGTVARISADRIRQRIEGDGEDHYQVVVTFGTVPADVRLVPGMPVTVVIPTRSRTAIDYLLSPLKDALSRSLREV
ncbi:HlyD family type I secretion periplasmic adaptor subunit [Acuticoccus sp.]|uniref:HlyD family type I secretion periplasmic adaptor subunit n=1 Tax=Acuticoccus sp. TaxID=1904378 RepID=UPI003B528C8E